MVLFVSVANGSKEEYFENHDDDDDWDDKNEDEENNDSHIRSSCRATKKKVQDEQETLFVLWLAYWLARLVSWLVALKPKRISRKDDTFQSQHIESVGSVAANKAFLVLIEERADLGGRR